MQLVKHYKLNGKTQSKHVNINKSENINSSDDVSSSD